MLCTSIYIYMYKNVMFKMCFMTPNIPTEQHINVTWKSPRIKEKIHTNTAWPM